MTETEEAEIDYIVFDLETTGFVAPEAKILEIGCFIMQGGILTEKHWVFQNNCEIPEKITEITGITKEIIDKEGRDPKECLKEFLPLFKKAKKNITHNGIKFDIPFLVAYAADVMGYFPQETEAVTKLIRSKSFDTAVHFKADKLGLKPKAGEKFMHFADRVMSTWAKGIKFNLGLCCDEIGIDRTNIIQHRAMADVHLTHEIYKKIHNL